MRRSIAILGIESNADTHAITDLGARSQSHGLRQIKVEASITGRHQIDLPRYVGFVIGLDPDRHEFAPVWLEAARLACADEYTGLIPRMSIRARKHSTGNGPFIVLTRLRRIGMALLTFSHGE